MPGSPDINPVDRLAALGRVGVSRGLSPIDTPSPVGAENWFRERLPRFSKEALLAPYMGKPKGEIIKEVLKEVVVSAGTSAALRIALTTATGASGGIGIAAGVGAGAAAIREVRRQGKEHQSGSADRLTLKEHLKSLEKGKLAGAIGKGAILGMVGFEFVNLEPVQGFGRAIGDIAGAVGGAKDGTLDKAGAIKDNLSVGTPEIKHDTPILGGITGVAKGVADTAGGVKDSIGSLKDNINLGTPEIKPDTPILGGVTQTAHNVSLKVGEVTHLGGNMPWDARVAPVIPETAPPVPEPIQPPAAPPPAEAPPAPPAPVPAPEPIAALVEPGAPAVESGHIIHAGPDSPEIKVPDNLPPEQQWMLGADDIHEDYGLMKQAEVGRILPNIDQILQGQGITETNTDAATLDAIRNHLQHVAEVEVNKAFDSHLQEAVNQGMSLDQIKEIGHKDFTDWLTNEAPSQIQEQANLVTQVHDQIPEVLKPQSQAEIYPVQSFHSGEEMNQFMVRIQGYPRYLGLEILANYDLLTESWRVTYPDTPFPAYLGEIDSLITKAEQGDEIALGRLHQAFGGKAIRDGIYSHPLFGVRSVVNRLLGLLDRLK